MNRIFELAKQAELIQWESLPGGAITPDYTSVANARKFAELIIKDCTDLCEQWNTTPAGRISTEIKNHFGVK